MKNHPPEILRREVAFTLVELLVSIAVLVLMVVLVSQLTNNATKTTTFSNQRLDSDSQARVAFGRMAYDFENMVNRKDVDVFFVKNNGGSSSAMNDAMYFYSQTPGYYSDPSGKPGRSPLALIGYRIANHDETGNLALLYPDAMLERMAVGLHYDRYAYDPTKTPQRVMPGFLTFEAGATLPTRDSTIPDRADYALGKDSPYNWDGKGVSASFGSGSNLQNSTGIIAEGVFRLEFCFQVKDPAKFSGQKFVVPVAPGKEPWKLAAFAGPGQQTNNTNITMRQIHSDAAAVIVTIAVIDPKNREIVSVADLEKAAQALPDGNDPSVARTWIQKINDGSLQSAAKIPQRAATSLRVYQRAFYLNPQ